jgi:hypothetical protein
MRPEISGKAKSLQPFFEGTENVDRFLSIPQIHKPDVCHLLKLA